MSQPLWQFDWDYVVHFIIGAAITGAVVTGLAFAPDFPLRWAIPFVMVPVALGVGISRERSQHEGTPLTAHQWFEALLFGVGALVAAGVGVAF